MEKRRLIIVDDDLTFGNFVAEVVKMIGFDVDVVTSVKQFKQLFQNAHYDVVTMDISMPTMDGFEFIDELVSLNCQAEIILLSGMDETILNGAHKIATTKGLNVIAVMRKPFDVEELEAVLLK